jgi:hypothetical protein
MIRAVVVAGIIDHQCLTFPFHYTHSATFNNISVILWQSILLLEETGVPGEKH